MGFFFTVDEDVLLKYISTRLAFSCSHAVIIRRDLLLQAIDSWA